MTPELKAVETAGIRRAPGFPSRVAMISVHTSPLDQPGSGDAGGMNVYVVELATRLAQAGLDVEIFTRATSGDLPPEFEIAPGVLVRHIVAGPFTGLTKQELPAQLCVFAREVLRVEASHALGHYDLVHSHYWLSGQVGALASDRWGVPLVHTMHTMARIKNAALAAGDRPEPMARLIGEEQVVEAADLLLANTRTEARQLVELYGAPEDRVKVVHPGVDLDVFRPGDRRQARERVAVPVDAKVMMFVGRLQPLKGPDVTIRAAAELLRRRPDLRSSLVVLMIGGPSGTGVDEPDPLGRLADELGVSDVVRFLDPVERRELAAYYQAADVVTVPSYNESFGLVAIEAQACGTPVVAADVGGLSTAVRDGVGGVLVEGHRPADYATAVEELFRNPALHARLARSGAAYARDFSWNATAHHTLAAYRSVLARKRSTLRIAAVDSLIG